MQKENITEQDIFNYVNFPDSLTKEKMEFISRNEDIFKSDIEFCKKNEDRLPDSVIVKINSTFFPDEAETIIDLFPLDADVGEVRKEYVLAADSGVNESEIKIDTFTDKNNQFLLKILSADNKRKFYCYKHSGELLNNYYLTLFPSQNEIYQESDSNWIEFPDDVKIENIKIKFHPKIS